MSVDKDAIFPKLRINWSIYNAPSPSSSEEGLREGLIGTNILMEKIIYIYSVMRIVIQMSMMTILLSMEWGHYFEGNNF